MEADIESKDQDTYDAKHDLVSAQVEIAKLKKEIERLKGERTKGESLKGGGRR